ncbi:MAG: hypothetical protein IPP88_03680 [Betaproteobacteria bacterium]|nr:hypothetical protein [Betaproteobacteria bacterium]
MSSNLIVNLVLLAIGAAYVLLKGPQGPRSLTSMALLLFMGICMVAVAISIELLSNPNGTIIGVLLLQEGGFCTLCGYLCFLVALQELSWYLRLKWFASNDQHAAVSQQKH